MPRFKAFAYDRKDADSKHDSKPKAFQMARPNKLWYRKDRKTYYVTIDGKTHNLGKEKAAAEKMFHKLKAADSLPSSLISVAELLDRFLVWVQQNRAQSTFATRTIRLQSFLDSLQTPSMDAMQVRPLHISEWLNPDWSSSYQSCMASTVQRAFRWGVRQGYISENPIERIEKPSMERRDNCPSFEDYKKMLRHSNREFRQLLAFVWQTGARPQEARAIEERHIQGDQVIFPVNESKGRKHARVIYLNEKAKTLLTNTASFAFCNSRGRPWTKDSINCAMRRIAKKTGKKFALYDLRHAWVTRMLEAGMGHLTVAKLAGHRDASMISRHYSHIGEQSDFLLRELRRVG
ncbi:MAG: site-specific integrase [Planctomycetota bacterium]